eukprot:jgi/Ulvmu1/1843/UM119_0062.1
MDLNFDDEDFRERVRQMLRGRAPGQFRFCDDSDSENPTEAPQLPPRVLSAMKSSNMIEYGRLASTEDHPDQGVEMTVKDDGNFWSSTGSPHDVGEEFLLYKLKYPFSLVRAVEVQVYRAAFQGGGPIYPAKQLLVEVGHSPSTMRAVGGPYTMACTDTPQTFLLPPNLDNAAVGSFLAIRFRGKYQKQHFDDSFYLSMRYVRVLGSQCSHNDGLAMKQWIANPLPPPDALGPTCAPPSLSAALDSILGTPNSMACTQQPVHMPQDASTCVIEMPKWAQRDIARSLYQMSEYDGRTGGGKKPCNDRKDHRASCSDRASGHAWPWATSGMPDNTDSSAERYSAGTAGPSPGTSHCSSGNPPHAWSLRCEAANCPTLRGYNWQQPRRPASAGVLERMLMRGLPQQCRPSSSAGTPSCTVDDSKKYSLPPIEPLRTTEAETGPSCRLLPSGSLRQGPLQHSVDEHGFLRCVIWERNIEASAAHLRCEGADDSEVDASLAAAAPRSRPPHVSLLLCNQVPSSTAEGIQLVGARKRAASSVGVGSPLKAARESNGNSGKPTASDIHSILFGQVQSVQFVVPLN